MSLITLFVFIAVLVTVGVMLISASNVPGRLEKAVLMLAAFTAAVYIVVGFVYL
jgi:hypothetical protein